MSEANEVDGENHPTLAHLRHFNSLAFLPGDRNAH